MLLPLLCRRTALPSSIAALALASLLFNPHLLPTPSPILSPSNSPSCPPIPASYIPSFPSFLPFQLPRSHFSSSMAAVPTTIYDFTSKDVTGKDVDFRIYRGKVLLIVNVASQCGLTTTNYKELTELYDKYKDQGFEILAFPCNQFGGQEPGSNEEIQEFACTRFKAEYPIFDKVDVNGANTSPIYKFLKDSKGGGIFGDSIKWNFTKFLVNKDGQVVERFAPTTAPSKIEKNVKKLLGVS